MKNKRFLRRTLMIALSLVMVLTMVPVIGVLFTPKAQAAMGDNITCIPESDGIAVYVYYSGSVSSMTAPTWTQANGQDDIGEWLPLSQYNRTINGVSYNYYVKIPYWRHNNESGLYSTHIYVNGSTFYTYLDYYVACPKQYNTEYHYNSGTQFIGSLVLYFSSSSNSAASNWLSNNGWTDWSGNFNAGDGHSSDYVHSGYKTTTNPAAAIKKVLVADGHPDTVSYGGYTYYAVGGGAIAQLPAEGDKKVDLNKGNGGDDLYLMATVDNNAGPALTALTKSQSGNSGTAQNNLTNNGYTIATDQSGNIQDTNAGAGGDFNYVGYKSSGLTEVDADDLRDAYKSAVNRYQNGGSGISGLSTAISNAYTILNDIADGYTTYTQAQIDAATQALNWAAAPISLGTATTFTVSNGHAGAYGVYAFTPSSTGKYVFFSNAGVDTKGWIYTKDTGASDGFSQITNGYNDDVSSGSDQYKILGLNHYYNHYVKDVQLTAGTTYYLRTQYYSGDAFGSYPVYVCKSVDLTFHAANGSTDPKTYQYFPAGYSLNLTKVQSLFSRDGHTQLGWATDLNTKEPRAYTMTQTITIPNSNANYAALWNPSSPTTVSVNTDTTATVAKKYQIVYYKFTPSSTRNYIIYSFTGGTDSVVVLYNQSAWANSASIITHDDTGGKSHSDFTGSSTIDNFFLRQELTANTNYLIGVKCYGDNTGDVPFRVEPVYKITFNANGGENAPAAADKFVDKTYTFTSAAPTRNGYTFKGWSTSSTATSATYVEGSTYNGNADLTLYAVWEANKYTLTLNKNGGSGGTDTVTATFNAAMPSLASAPTRSGYTFAGYYDTSAATGGTKYYNANRSSAHTWDKYANTTESNTLYARWDPNVTLSTGTGYTVTQNPAASVAYNGSTTFKITLSTGYTNSGVPSVTASSGTVTSSKSGNEITYTVTGITATCNITVGSATINSYNVTFSKNGTGYTNTTPASTVNHGGSVSFTVTLSTGYTNSANPSVTATNGTVTSTKSGNTITYTVSNITAATNISVGAATINTYTVTFKAEDGTVLKTETVQHGSSVTPPTAQTKAPDATYHYTFNAWSGYTNITADTTITASFTPVPHTPGGWQTDASQHWKTCTSCGYYTTPKENHSGGTATCAVKAKCTTCQAEYGAYDNTNHDYELTGWAWNDAHTSATATFTCKNNNTHVETVTDSEPVTNTVSAQTCTTDYVVTYTATVTFEGETYTNTTDNVKLADRTGHDYELTGWTWAEDHSSATATFTCKNNNTHVETVTDSEPVTNTVTAQTCTTDYVVTYTATVTFEGETYTNTTDNVKLADQTGHDYELTGWTWAEDHSSATATFTCKNNNTHVETVIDSEPVTNTVTAQTCTTDYVVTYTATVTFEGETYTNTTDNVKLADQTGHDYELTGWTWNDAHTSATATFTCKNNNTHVETVTDSEPVTNTVTAQTCTTDYVVTYTATVTFEGETYTNTTDNVKLADQTGHDYELTGWAWAEDYSSATATFTCKNNNTHVETVIDSEPVTNTVTAQTCTTDYVVTYTATVTFEGTEYTNTTDNVKLADRTGHDYELTGWAWAEDHTSATATFTCKNNNTHVETVIDSEPVTNTVTAQTCTTDYVVTYTATVTFEGTEYTNTTDNVKLADQTGHDYELTGWTWAEDHSSATATFTCKNNNTHVETVIDSEPVTNTVTAQTCTTDYVVTYTATVTFEGETYTGTADEVKLADRTGHDYELTGWTWNDAHTSATATFTCKNNGEHVETVVDNAPVTNTITAQTCTTDYVVTYTATVTFEGETYTNTTDNVKLADQTGHDYELTGWAWNDAHTSATATFTCKNNNTHIETVTDSSPEMTTVTAQTCTTDYVVTYTATVTFEGTEYTNTTDNVKLADQTGHDYELTGWAWAEDHGSATATFTCKNNNTHVETVTDSSPEMTTVTAQTCTTDYVVTYTATVTFEGETYTNTTDNVKLADQTGHDYELTGWTWEEDHSSATATFTCKNNNTHVETVTDSEPVTNTVTAQTCTTDYVVTYTATVTFEGETYTNTTDNVKLADRTGHDYELTGWAWAEDHGSATATFTCKNNNTHIETVTDSSPEMTTVTAQTCTTDYVVTYTATVTFEGETYTNTTDNVKLADQTGHDYELTGWAWAEDHSSATATFTCKNNNTHVETVTDSEPVTNTVSAQTCTTDYVVTYTATVTFEGETYTNTTDNVKLADRTGHDYELTGWTWAEDHGSATATFTCKNNNTHVETVTDSEPVTNTVSAQTCTTDYVVTYTATVTFEGETYTNTTDNVKLADRTGHDYELTGWAWAEDHSSATATFTCKNNNTHVETVTDSEPVTNTVTAQTCTTDYVVTYTATVTFGGTEYTDTTDEVKLADRTGHDYVETVIDPTCLTAGYTKHVCSRCGDNYNTDPVTALGHDFDETITANVTIRSATCTVDGLKTVKCSRCTETKETVLGAPGHTPGEEMTENYLAPTYEADGGYDVAVYCTVCGDELSRVHVTIPKLTDITVEDDPTDVSVTYRSDSFEAEPTLVVIRVLDETERETVNAMLPAGFYKDTVYEIHMEVDGVETQPANAVTVRIPVPEGYVAAEISVYHIADDNTVTPVTFTVAEGMIIFTTESFSNYAICATHTPAAAVEENRVEPTCTEAGKYDSVVYCTLCEAELSREADIEIPANGHTPGETMKENIVPNTCMADGSYQDVVYCAVCGEELSRETVTVPADPDAHVWDEWTVFTPATCTEDGIEIRFCTLNHDHYDIRTVAASGHNWGAWVTVTAATADTNGLEQRTCLTCDEIEERQVIYSDGKDRQIQFVVSGKMHYIVHFDELDYLIYSKTTPAIYWYSDQDLTFDVALHNDYAFESYQITLNGEPLAPNADGSFTIPADRGFVMINIVPIADIAVPSGGTAAESDGVCNYCGKTHPATIWGRIVAFFHAILWFFKNIFK